MQNDLIAWYIKDKEYDENEKLLLRIAREATITQSDDEHYNKLIDEYFKRMPFCNISTKNRIITFDESGTAFIDKIFDKEVDDDTLVISTTYEHGSVQKRLSMVKNKLLLNSDLDIRGYSLNKILKEAKKYKKVFVYVIGTQLSTGEITPQEFFIKLKENFDLNNIQYKMLIDDVHGMFLVPRDYSIFDYVLYTAHSLVTEYDMGILISKDGKFGKKAYNWGKDYLDRLDIILKNKDKMLVFRQILIQYLSHLLSDLTVFRLYNQTVEHIFAVETDGIFYTEDEWEKLDSYKIRVSEHTMQKNWIRIRYQEFTRLPASKAIEGLEFLVKLLNKKILLKNMKEA